MDELCPVLLLDTNVVLDWLAFGDAAIVPIAEAVASGRVRLISSAACIDELQRALGYKAIKLDAAAQARALATYRGRAELRDAPPEGSLPMLPRCEDRDDQKFLELAWHARARWLVSRDKALLKLAPKLARMGRFAVIPPDVFLLPCRCCRPHSPARGGWKAKPGGNGAYLARSLSPCGRATVSRGRLNFPCLIRF